MTQAIEMRDMYSRLSQIGLKRKYIREKALPCWWDSELESDPVAVMEAAGYIAKRLGIDIRSLLKPDAPIVFRGSSNPKFKKRQGTDEKHLLVAQGIATRVAEMVTSMSHTAVNTPKTAWEIRQEILKNDSQVDLEALTRFCWNCGIAVVHFSDYPKDVAKMDGMAAILNKKPAIVISSSKRFSAWLLFILAHELGHIVCGHVKDGVLVDESVAEEKQDDEEREANDFASSLLLGRTDKYQWQNKLYVPQLVSKVRIIAQQDKIDPGVLALNYAWKTRDWKTGVGALKKIEPNADAPARINSYLAENLDWESLDEDSQDYLKLVTGV